MRIVLEDVRYQWWAIHGMDGLHAGATHREEAWQYITTLCGGSGYSSWSSPIPDPKPEECCPRCKVEFAKRRLKGEV